MAFTAYMEAYMGFFSRKGLGLAVPVAIGALLGALGTALPGMLIILIVTILRVWPRLFTGAFLGAITFFVVLFGLFGSSPGFPFRIGSTLVLIMAGLCGALSVLLCGGSKKAKRSHRITAIAMMILVLSVTESLFVWLASPGKPGDGPLLEAPTAARFHEYCTPGRAQIHPHLDVTRS